MAQLLFHSSDDELPVGTVLEGRFGVLGDQPKMYEKTFAAYAEGPAALKRLELNLLKLHSDWDEFLPTYIRETLFEAVRAEQFPDRPQRLGGIYLWPTLEDLNRFNSLVPKGELHHRSNIYLCGVEGVTSPPLDLSLVRQPILLAPIDTQIRSQTSLAVRYWQGQQDQGIWEIITHGTVTVVETVSLKLNEG